ncbi:hypothetical protein PLICRDRAFT_97562 [Plicaturopsis crispa FD-325 SS-3]|nr:hypothetical protein PLICRDRAFT_97562 [Plicaturopsis crispa FD-325 SS-3]
MAAIAPLKTLIVQPVVKHSATVIFVHGLGDTGFGWKPVADMFQSDPKCHHIKWVLPHSPTKPVTANMGMEMPSWFDIISFGFDSEEDSKGMLETVHSLNQLITAEVDSGIEPGNIVLGGFSQGATMSLLTGLSSERKLGGIVVLSGWLPLRDRFKAMAGPHARTTPIFWGHGLVDPLVRYQFGVDSVAYLKAALGIPEAPAASTGKPQGLDFRSYDGVGHSTNQKELDDLRAWLARALPIEGAT